jgi:uncharacterized protein
VATGPHRVLICDYVADVLERRAPHREAHLARIAEWIEGRGLLAAGALGDPPTGALFVFSDVPEADVEEFADGDPYRAAGIVTARRVLPWTVVASA